MVGNVTQQPGLKPRPGLVGHLGRRSQCRGDQRLSPGAILGADIAQTTQQVFRITRAAHRLDRLGKFGRRLAGRGRAALGRSQ